MRNTLGIWIGLNFLETVLFYYLLFGIVIDRKTLKKGEKIILYVVLAGTAVIISVWVRKSVFSTYGYLLTMLLLLLGCFFSCRKKPVLLAGIATMYQSATMLSLYMIVYFITFIYEIQAENPQIFIFREHENEVFCVEYYCRHLSWSTRDFYCMACCILLRESREFRKY